MPKCDKCPATMNLFACLVNGKYHPKNQHRCGFCLEDDKSMDSVNGEWVKYNSVKNMDEYKREWL